jgi:hypothetical protein
VSLWFYADDITPAGESTLFSFNGPAAATHGQLELRLKTNSSLTVLQGSTVLISEGITVGWHNFIVTQNSTNAAGYLDGVLFQIGPNNNNSAGDIPGGTVKIAASRDGASGFFSGKIDEVGFWNRSLSAAEALELYNSGDALPFNNTPVIGLNSPADSLSTENDTVNFNITVTSPVRDIINVSLLVDSVIVETNTSGATGEYMFTETLTAGTHNWSILVTDNLSVETTSQNRSLTTGNFSFGLCNATLTVPYLNLTFKDEGNLSVINASIPTSTFLYNVLGQSVTKTLSFINTTENPSYAFCATPGNMNLEIDSLIQYKQGSAYPQRVFSQTGATLTNTTTNLTLYLLGVSDGLFVTFQVLNVAEQPIDGVSINATRILEGSDTLVSQGTTDAAGSVTFWLNPDFLHTITFSKTGLDTETLSVFPTQTAYTVSMGGETVTEPDQTRGVSLVVQPTLSFLFNDTTYNFNYTISSTYWNLDEFGYTLIYSNGTTIDTQSSTASSGGVLNTNANTLNSSWIRMDYYYLINETYTNATRIWYIQNTEGTEYSISNFFERLIIYIDAGMFGFDNFGKALISFLILVLVAGGLSFRYGINSEVAIMGIIFGLVLVLDVGLGLIPNPQLATQAGLENIVTIITGIILFGFLAKEELR